MSVRFTEEAVRSVHAAVVLAERRDDRKVGTEHLLLGVVSSGSPIITQLLSELGMDQAGLLSTLEAFDEAALSSVGIEASLVETTVGVNRLGSKRHRPFTRGAKDTLHASQEEAKLIRHRYLGPEHILLALSRRPTHDVAHRLLASLGWEPGTLRARIMTELRRSS